MSGVSKKVWVIQLSPEASYPRAEINGSRILINPASGEMKTFATKALAESYMRLSRWDSTQRPHDIIPIEIGD